ncbi:MAG: hypothetical protein OEW67_11315 [Cyclobacteriaceae bacterium]|nr:hypothetical protein [Cyclobacteriaceae bacterium]
MSDYFNEKEIESLSRVTGFTQRKSKLSAVNFLNNLMFVHQQGKDLSLLDICGDLYSQYDMQITKQSIANAG